ncbi:hypothetical protein GALMADRAFT_858991 [Galerina marginata CBS 339.88]|uniref:Uncharacterized protein n=1 Tax=Galerina marginata (strain CBS 339.88) TaxID=685588 RepID=A0A067TI85_GALM3|nr:hypothetical protein GALMADRAFT_858991 [Galerina marginata CBS 339.88]
MEAFSGTSTMVSTDPVSSLRAAALSTLKRRKPVLEPTVSIPSRPTPPSDSFQLDYGQEDKAHDASMAAIVSENKDKTTIPQVGGDTQMREEGEISEEEEPPPLPKPPPTRPRKLSKPPRLANSRTPEPRKVLEAKSSSLPPPSGVPPRKIPTPEMQFSRPPALTLMDRISDPFPDVHMLETMEEPLDAPMEELESQLSLPPVGPDRVRPGLDLNQEEYDTIKDIILDLLGWAVPFEYLVECGLSKEVVYYVFNELDLRIPDTFDTSGIVPYTPEAFSRLQQSALMPPPPIPEKQRHGSIDSDMSAMMDASTKETTPPIPVSLPIVDSPSNSDLHDMERQRRQELMARKAAVQASRKLKQPISGGNSLDISYPQDSMSVDQVDVPVGPAVPTETVEDFLKSLGPVQALEVPPAIAISPEARPASSVDADQVPEQSTHEKLIQSEEQKPNLSAMESTIPGPFAVSSTPNLSVPESPRPLSEPLSTSVESFVPYPFRFSEAGPSTPSIPPTAPRRGVKRPVASDFVDFDPAPKRHERNNIIERTNSFGQVTGITRRLNSSMGFHNINSRRCVIDVSDSEDDDDEVGQQPLEDQLQMRREKRSKHGKFPSPAPVKHSSSGDTSPAALLKKELEIRKMRELIAQREEETRLRKLALAKLSSTTLNGQASIKVEEPDVVMATGTPDDGETNGHAPRSSESATPPSSVEPSTRPFPDENNLHVVGAIQDVVLENQGKSLPLSYSLLSDMSSRHADPFPCLFFPFRHIFGLPC